MTIKEAFLQIIKDYPNLDTAKTWRQKLKNGTLSDKTMRKHLENAGWIKIHEEQWSKLRGKSPAVSAMEKLTPKSPKGD